jgi:Predicted transcriptional regulators
MATDIKMSVNDRIKARRKELGLTLKQVADALNVSEATVSRYESNDIQNMGINKLEPLAQVLKCSPVYLLSGYTDIKEKEESIISKYNLDEYELSEYNKIMSMNMLMFNDKEISEDDKVILEQTLKEIFVKSLLKKRAKEKE